MKQKVVLTITLILILTFMLSGCGTPNNSDSMVPVNVAMAMPSEGGHAMVIIVGNNANEPANTLGNTVGSRIDEMTVSGETSVIYLVQADGHPSLYDQITVGGEKLNGLSEKQIRRKQQDVRGFIQDSISSMKPVNPEVDIIECIRFGASLLSSSGANNQTLAFVKNNLLSTTGLLNMATHDYLSANINVATVVTSIMTLNPLGNTNLNNVSVMTQGLSEVAGDQPQLSYTQRNHLIDLYQNLFQAMGAKEISIQDVAGMSSGVASSTPCSIVAPVADDDIIGTLSNSKLPFKGDSTELLISREEAKAVLSPIANAVKSSQRSIVVAGTTASGRTDFCRKLSYGRSQTVGEILKELGVDPALIHLVGCGCDMDPWHINDVDEHSNLIEAYAAENRAVRVVYADSYIGQKLLQS